MWKTRLSDVFGLFHRIMEQLKEFLLDSSKRVALTEDECKNILNVLYSPISELYERDRVSVKYFPEMGLYEVVHHKQGVRVSGAEPTLTRFHDDCFSDVEYITNAEDVMRTTSEEESIARVARRIRARVKDLALSNKWDYWVTLTVSPDKCDRYNLREVTYLFLRLVKRRNEAHPDWEPFKYCLIPEKHDDGAYHFHGFIKGVYGDELRLNKNWKVEIDFLADGLGFVCLKPIRLLSHIDRFKLLIYTLKYATKAATSCRGEMNRGYLCSRGLIRPEVYVLSDHRVKTALGYANDTISTYENEYLSSRIYNAFEFEELLSMLDLSEVDKIGIVNDSEKLGEYAEKCALRL